MSLNDLERLRLAATIASYLLAPNQGERPNPALAHAALDIGLGSEYFSKAARVEVEPFFDDPFFRKAAHLQGDQAEGRVMTELETLAADLAVARDNEQAAEAQRNAAERAVHEMAQARLQAQSAFDAQLEQFITASAAA